MTLKKWLIMIISLAFFAIGLYVAKYLPNHAYTVIPYSIILNVFGILPTTFIIASSTLGEWCMDKLERAINWIDN